MCMFIGNLKITCLFLTGNQIKIYQVTVKKPQHNYIAQRLSTKQRNITRTRISASSGCVFEEIFIELNQQTKPY